MKPNARFVPGGARMYMQSSWDFSVKKLKEVNDTIYKNRPIDLTTVPELLNPIGLHPVPKTPSLV